MKNEEMSLIAHQWPEEVWSAAFEEMCQRIAPLFGRSETRERAKSYLIGLLSQIPRKNGWQIAEEIGEKTPYSIQYFLDRAKWNVDELRAELGSYVCEHLGAENGVVVLDETGFIKKGNKSVGVQRQYSGTAGRIENCQIGVFLSYTSARGHTLLDRELYLPKSWIEEPERCQQAGVPEGVKFATKPELAIKMLNRTFETRLPVAWVVGDTVYGSSKPLRTSLEARRKSYALAVSCQERVIKQEKPQRVDEIADAQAANDWKCLSAGAGSKGPRWYDWLCIPLKEAGIAGWGHWLLVRRSRDGGEKAPEMAYILVFAPLGTPLQKMVEIIGSRWTVEECFEDGKGEVGMDEYEVRSWHGWYRHITCCMLVMAFLTVLRIRSQTLEMEKLPEKAATSPSPSATAYSEAPMAILPLFPMMVPISFCEIKKLFYYLVSSKLLSWAHRLAWSFWRRTHQALARLFHYQCRIRAASYLQL